MSPGWPLRRFFEWWLSELAAAVRPALGRLPGRGRRHLWLLLREGSTEVEEDSGGARRPLGSLPAESLADGLATLPALKRGWSTILAVIPAERALHRRLQLPAAVAENLEESIGFEIDRLTPFRAEDVVYRARAAGLDRARGQLACDLWVVPRGVVEDALARLRALGVRPDRLCVERRAGEAPAVVELPAAPEGRLARWLPWRLPAALAALAGCLAAAAFLLHLERKEAMLAAYAAEAAKYRQTAEAAARLRERVRGLIATEAAAAGRRSGTPLAVDVLAEVTARLPDDTWLTELKLSDGHLLVSGYASSAASLVPVIEDSPLFRGARLSGPVVPDAQLKRERFSIEAEARPKAGS